MKLPSKMLTCAGLGVGACCLFALTPVTAGAQTQKASPSVPHQVAQVRLQPRPQLQSQSQPAQSGTMLARLSLRITELENEIRRLTGQNEELTYRLGQLEELMKQSASDSALRLGALERGGSVAKGTEAATTGTAAPSKAAVALVRPKSSVRGADKGAKVLGAIRRDNPGTPIAPAIKLAPVAKAETPEQQYDRAHSLIVKQRKYGEAGRVLRSFIDGNPKHTLTPNAHYWLGRTYFVRADYENAAFAFAEGFQKFPEAQKAPANLLNLGMSLARLGKNREACTTYTRLLRTYNKAGNSLKRRVTRERRRAKCRGR